MAENTAYSYVDIEGNFNQASPVQGFVNFVLEMATVTGAVDFPWASGPGHGDEPTTTLCSLYC